jgi:predicted phosphodiesterase
VLYSTGVFKRLYDEHEAVFERDGVKVRVVGIPYHGTKYDLDRFRNIKRGDEHHLVCVAHVLASERGGTMFEGEDVVRYSDLLDTAPDLFCFGHWHKDQGVTTLGDKTFVNIGSLTRGSLSQDEVERQPACAVLSFLPDGRDIRVVRLKVKPADDVFDVERRQRADNRRMEMDAFVSTLRDTLAQEPGEGGVAGLLAGMGEVPEQVRERALAYLERVN